MDESNEQQQTEQQTEQPEAQKKSKSDELLEYMAKYNNEPVLRKQIAEDLGPSFGSQCYALVKKGMLERSVGTEGIMFKVVK